MAVRREFLTRIDKATRQANSRLDFYVLVWGSGRSNAQAFRKRRQIREALESECGEGRVFFSEDRSLRDFTKREGVIRSELEQLKGVDFAVVLATSLGPLLEVALYYEQLRNKALILAPRQYKSESSFAFHVMKLVDPYWYSAGEFKTCRLRSICLDKVKTHRAAKLLRTPAGG